jgi:PIN domain nuclease of toxin-antitoxin system
LKILLDTHAFLWIIGDDPRLSSAARDIFLRPENEVALSVASVWEILVKTASGKFQLPQPAGPFLRAELRKNSVTVLPILLQHVLRVEQLPLHHRNPFDRIIVAQAIEEKIPLVSADAKFSAYPVELLW